MHEYNEQFWTALDELTSSSRIVVDRPKNSRHPRFPDLIYPVDYGYLENTLSMDGEGIDVWVGSGDRKVVGIVCIVDLYKRDSEIKILLGCTKEEREKIYALHNATAFMKGILVERPSQRLS